MSLSWNEDYFPDDNYWSYTFWNQSTIYINGSNPEPNYWCNATIKADPDIAGLGIIIGFVATGWYTCLIAAIAQFCIVSDQIRDFWKDPEPGRPLPGRFHRKARDFLLEPPVWIKMPISWIKKPFKQIEKQTISFLGENSKFGVSLQLRREGLQKFFSRDHTRLKVFAQILLDSLCDLQIITGTAILIAAWVQGDSISFYHEQLVQNYWSLTLNSFWAARAGDMDSNYRASLWHKRTRTFAILCSIVLSTVFQAHSILREERDWDPFSNGYCYFYNDKASPKSAWLWVAGLALYSLYLILYLISLIFPRRTGRNGNRHLVDTSNQDVSVEENGISRPAEEMRDTSKPEEIIWMDNLSNWFNEKLKRLKTWYLKLFHNCLFWPDTEDSCTHSCGEDYRIPSFWAYSLEFVAYFPIILAWIFFQFLALVSYGNSESLALVLAYFGFAAWNTYDIVDLKNSNRDIIEGSEEEWRFGQVFPVVLLALIVLQTFDAAERARSREEEKKVTNLVAQVDAEVDINTRPQRPEPRHRTLYATSVNPRLYKHPTNKINRQKLTNILTQLTKRNHQRSNTSGDQIELKNMAAPNNRTDPRLHVIYR